MYTTLEKSGHTFNVFVKKKCCTKNSVVPVYSVRDRMTESLSITFHKKKVYKSSRISACCSYVNSVYAWNIIQGKQDQF